MYCFRVFQNHKRHLNPESLLVHVWLANCGDSLNITVHSGHGFLRFFSRNASNKRYCRRISTSQNASSYNDSRSVKTEMKKTSTAVMRQTFLIGWNAKSRSDLSNVHFSRRNFRYRKVKRARKLSKNRGFLRVRVLCLFFVWRFLFTEGDPPERKEWASFSKQADHLRLWVGRSIDR